MLKLARMNLVVFEAVREGDGLRIEGCGIAPIGRCGRSIAVEPSQLHKRLRLVKVNYGENLRS